MPPIFSQNWLPGEFCLRMGVFINDLHEPFERILEGLIQTHSDTNLALGGSDLGASVTTSPADIAMVALDQADWRAPLLAYLFEEVLPPKRIKAR